MDPLLPSRRVKGPLHTFPGSGEGVEFKMPVTARSKSTHLLILLPETQPLSPWFFGNKMSVISAPQFPNK